MSAALGRLKRLPTTLWEHKKKSAFGFFLLYLGTDFAQRWNRNRLIRTVYAKEALKHGEKRISPEDRPQRVCVLANVSANERHCYDDFTKNALPLLHLAGLQVDIIKADSAAQLEALAAAVDDVEADVLFVVGGDGTIGTVLTGIFRNRYEFRETAALPIGCFPGGYDNLTLKRLAPGLFDSPLDVRRGCESAMAVIENTRRNVSVVQLEVEKPGAPEIVEPVVSVEPVAASVSVAEPEVVAEPVAVVTPATPAEAVDSVAAAQTAEHAAGTNSETKAETVVDESPKTEDIIVKPKLPWYGIGDLGAGWFRHIEDKRKKMWYFGFLKRRWAYVWEMLKRSPAPLAISIEYDEPCTGCARCRPKKEVPPPPWRWWHLLLGPPRYKQTGIVEKDYSLITNEDCGKVYETDAAGTDFILQTEQHSDGAMLRLLMGGTDYGRFGVISEGWKRCGANRVGSSDDEKFYSKSLTANAVSLNINKMPVYVWSDPVSVSEGDRVRMSTTNKTVQMFVPTSLRVDASKL